MLNTTISYLALLQEDDIQFRSIALDKLSLLVDEHWSEISDYISSLKLFYTSKQIPEKQETIALILSKIYYNLEKYDEAINWALESKSKFNIKENSLYVSTLLKKILDKYIEDRKKNFYNKDNKIEIDPRIQNIVETIFTTCIAQKNISHAIGFSIDSFDLERLSQSIESSNDIVNSLKLVYEIVQDFVVNTEYKSAIINELLKLYIKHASKQYMDITNCQFLLNNTEALSNTLINIISEGDISIAYQIAFDLYENQNPSYLRLIISQIKKINDERKIIDATKLEPLFKILSGEVSKNLIMTILKNTKSNDDKLMEKLIQSAEKSGSVVHLGVIIANSLMNSHTGNDKFLKDKLDWVSKATNWARFCSSATLGVINMGNLENGYDIMKPYLPGGSSVRSIYSQGGGYYGLGLIYANTNDEKIKKILEDALNKPSNNKESILHGIFLALGLVSMGTHDQNLYERLRDGIYTDDALIGEAAGYAIGLVMAGSNNGEAIEDLMKYARDTQHEKIIRAIAIALSLIVYGAEQEADALIEQLSTEKDLILRYGAMYCIGMAYAGTGNTAMLKKLIKFSVTDVSDEVRRAAMINIGFLQIRNPDILFDKLKVVRLLSESYNNHVRYGAIMAIGICCAGSAKLQPYKLIEPLFLDSNYLVRQAAFMATGMIFSQTTTTQEPELKKFKEYLTNALTDKDEHVLIRFGALISQGLMELGGRNCSISLVNETGANKMSAIIGMNLFTQFYYWFPMIHFINLAANPSMLIGIDSNLKIVKNYKMLSKAKKSLYDYPKEELIPEKQKEVKVEAAVLSTHSRVKAKEKKTSTATLGEIKQSGSNVGSQGVSLRPAPSGPVPMEVDDDKKKEEKKEEEKKDDKKEEKKEPEEPDETIIENPFRIIPRQKSIVSEICGQDFESIVKGRVNGFILLKKIKNEAVVEYEEYKKVETKDKKEEEKKNEENNSNNYQPIPSEDVEMPEEIDFSKFN